MPVENSGTIEKLRRSARPLEDHESDFAPLLDAIGQRRFVLIGEGSHGTHEFYAARARLTRELIEKKGFAAVVVEADWPDAYRVNRFVRGFGDDGSADGALGGFARFPQWMWRNTDVVAFVEWLRGHNDALGRLGTKVGFYGMDLYSLSSSMEAVLRFLDETDHQAASRARFRYACFEQFGEDPQAYGYAASFDLGPSCEDQVVQQLVDLRRMAGDYARRDGRRAEDEYFYAEQNARLVKNAEAYYRAMFSDRDTSWNLRDQHMTETIRELAAFLDRMNGEESKLVIWAHNSHLGDARATEMGRGGELNVGQLMRQDFGRQETFLIGQTTHIGTVTAASRWDEPAQIKAVRPSLEGSYERLFHQVGIGQFLLLMEEQDLGKALLERAIGVIYRPETERLSHYFQAVLSEQFDAVIHFDQSHAVRPLEARPAPSIRAEEETYPSGV